MKTIPCILLLISCGLCLPETRTAFALEPTSRGLSVWTETETRRFLRADPPETGLTVILNAARNEWEGFQILLRSDTPVNNITIEPGDLTGPAGEILHASTARLYREHQVEITEGTWRNYTFVPGWYSDALIPFKHPLTGQPLSGAEYTAVPFNLPADQTHAFFVDLPVPADAVPGTYTGIYLVKTGATILASIPIQLTVWDFVLPHTPTLQTDFGPPKDSIKVYYEYRAAAGLEPEPADWNALRDQCNEMMSRHGLNAFPERDMMVVRERTDGSYFFIDAEVDALRDFIDTYHVNCVRIPTHARGPAGLISWLMSWGMEDEIPEYLAAWDDVINRLQRPHVRFYNYLYDEPNDMAAYDFIRQWGPHIYTSGSKVKALVVEPTLPDPGLGDLYGSVNLWCPIFRSYDPASARERQALGEHIWTYTALCQDDYTPKWQTDFPLIEYRVPAWISWRHDIEGLLYWAVACWHLNRDLAPDCWTDPKTYETEWMGQMYIFNGDGCMMYPARRVGFEGITPSIRVKALRDSIEDFEYLAILERMGLESEAMNIVLPIAGSWSTWTPDPAAYEQARLDLAALITANRLPGDMNRDGFVNAEDFASFCDCLNGPSVDVSEAECAPANLDGDEDVDLADFCAFQRAYGG